jgi:hypothetical protein
MKVTCCFSLTPNHIAAPAADAHENRQHSNPAAAIFGGRSVKSTSIGSFVKQGRTDWLPRYPAGGQIRPQRRH